jgi:predicted dehydrogenase
MSPADSDYGLEPEGCEGQLYAGNEGKPELVRAPRGNYMAFYEGVYESIAAGRPEPVSADDGVRVMQVIDAAFQSQRDRAVVRP